MLNSLVCMPHKVYILTKIVFKETGYDLSNKVFIP